MLPDYPLDYPLDYELESCEDIIIEDLSSAADCADLCYDNWDCADWDFVEDEMKCVHKQFVSIVYFFYLCALVIFELFYREEYNFDTFSFFSVMNLF